MVFTYTTGTSDTSYTITAPAGGVVCDILIVGGGGGGGSGHGGGGGAGQLILIHQATLNGTYTIKVGKGGNGSILTSGGSLTSDATKGSNSEFGNVSINIIAEGGGANGGATLKDGGSGSGGDGYTNDSGVAGKGLKNTTIDTFSSGTVYSRGNDGGDGNNVGGGGQGGGGGGAGAVGTTGGNNVNTTIGHGGDGLSGISAISYDFKTNFGNYGKLETDGNYWFAGGGAGGIYYTTAGVVSNGGKGGGGSTPPNVVAAKNDGGSGVNGTGGGGAGGSAYYGSGGNGGSGIVIIRYLTPSSSSTIELLRGTTTDANHDWKLGNYDGDFVIKKSVNNVETDVLIIYKNQLNGLDIFSIPDGDLNVAGTIYTVALSSATISCNSLSTGTINATGLITATTITASGLITANNGLNVSGVANCYSTLNVSGATIMGGQLRVQGNNLVINGGSPTIFFRDSDARQGMIHINSGLMYFLSGPTTNSSDSVNDWATNYGEWPLILNLNTNEARFGGEITATFKAVSATDTDHLVVQLNYGGIGDAATLRIKVAFGTFTGFHRCYTDDELYNNETDEDIDIFKNKYIGRIVIATGKIKTDFTRKKGEEDEWYSGIDKDGITIEDAVPVVRLSRQRKDKRVFGVFGGIRSTNNKDRLIVNSVGEGAICVCNTNGNIENGDYIQSSDLLGYGEKQDDDLLHNYTVAKATIDCDFQSNSPYYQAHEIENGVRVAFIACSYHSG